MSKEISIGVTDLSFHRVTASLVAHVLSDMGFEVTRDYPPHEDNFKKLKSGETDQLASAWLPSSHGVYKADVEEVAPLGIVDRAVPLLRADKKSLFTKEELKTLNSLRFSNDIIAELDCQVSRCNEPLDEVTRKW